MDIIIPAKKVTHNAYKNLQNLKDDVEEDKTRKEMKGQMVKYRGHMDIYHKVCFLLK